MYYKTPKPILITHNSIQKVKLSSPLDSLRTTAIIILFCLLLFVVFVVAVPLFSSPSPILLRDLVPHCTLPYSSPLSQSSNCTPPEQQIEHRLFDRRTRFKNTGILPKGANANRFPVWTWWILPRWCKYWCLAENLFCFNFKFDFKQITVAYPPPLFLLACFDITLLSTPKESCVGDNHP